jgi:putative nucleotidyltransferase with HDIG domain
MKLDLTSTQQQLIETINKQGSCWVVGGAVRDLLLDRIPKDIDLVTNLVPDKVIILVEKLGLVRIPDATAYHHGITRVVDKETGEIIDIATLRSDARCDGRHCTPVFTNNIEKDLARRDFTINAIATKVDHLGNCGPLIDPFNGQYDIEHRNVIFVGDPEQRIQEDYLRMIRMCRFTALWGSSSYEVQCCKVNASSIHKVSKERVRDEIIKALSAPYPVKFWSALQKTFLVQEIFPALENTVGCTQNKHHDFEDVWNHSLRTLGVICELTENPMLRLAALMHDIGKPPVKSVDSEENIHFYEHEVEGATLAYEWMRKYRFSNEQTEYVSKLCRYHQWRFHDTTKDKTVRKWIQKVGKNTWEDLFTLRCADRKGNVTKKHLPMLTNKMLDLYNKAKEIVDSKQPLFKEDLAIDGNDIKGLGIKPGPKYKEMFSNILAVVTEDPSKNTKKYLLDYIQRHRKKFGE